MLEAAGTLFWNPPRDLFVIPVIEHPIRVYGILFALSFLFGYFYMAHLFSHCLKTDNPALTPLETRKRALFLADRLCYFTVIGTVIGARLGHVFFYQWSYYKQHPIEILQVWKGGLASHGGAIAVVIALIFYARFVLARVCPAITPLRLLDLAAIPTAFVAFCIRIGNFFNQEIVGLPTSMPWGIVFGDPFDGPAGIPLHPAQLYEATGYLATFVILALIWRRWKLEFPEGGYFGLLFFLVFTCRMIVENFKSLEVGSLHFLGLTTGQFLSIPFIVIGAFFLLRAKLKSGQEKRRPRVGKGPKGPKGPQGPKGRPQEQLHT